MHHLNLLPSPISKESPTSYLNRIAYANGFRNLKKLKSYLECNCTSTECLLADSTLIHTLLQSNKDLAPPDLSLFYKRSHILNNIDIFIINGISVPSRLVRSVHGARCPICLKNGWEHYIKDIKLIQRCPLHNTPYIFECPNCHKRTDWDAQILDDCICGYKIATSQNIFPVDAESEQTILRLFEDQSQEKFDSLLSGLRNYNYPLLSNQRPIDRSFLNAAVSVALGPPQALLKHLETIANQHPNIDRKLLLERLPKTSSQTIKEIYLEFIRITPRSIPRPPQELAIEPIFNRSQARKYLNLSRHEWCSALKTLTSEGLISSKGPLTNDRINLIREFLLTARSLSRPSPAASAILLTDVVTKLNVDRGRVLQLINSGFLEHFKTSGKTYVTQESLDFFNKKYVISSTLGRELGISPHAVKMRLASLAISPISGPKIDGNLTYLFLREDVIDVTKEMTYRRYPSLTRKDKVNLYKSLPAISDKGNSYLYCEEAASYLSLSTKLVRQLCQTSLLGKVCRLSSQRRYLIPKASVESFHKEYIGCRELKNKLHLPSNITSSTLKSVGISQATGIFIDGQSTPFFKRSDITEDTINRIQGELLAHFRGRKENRFSYVSLSGATHRLGITRKQIEALIEQHIIKIKTPAPNLSKYQTGVSLSSISKYENWISSQIPLKVALGKLGVSYHKFRIRFVACGFLKLFPLHNNLYIKEEDLLRAVDNMDKFCDLSECDRLLGVKRGYTKRNAPTHLIASSLTGGGRASTMKLLNKIEFLEHFKIPS